MLVKFELRVSFAGDAEWLLTVKTFDAIMHKTSSLGVNYQYAGLWESVGTDVWRVMPNYRVSNFRTLHEPPPEPQESVFVNRTPSVPQSELDVKPPLTVVSNSSS